MSTFTIILLALNGILLYAFGVAFFARKDQSVKIPGLIFGVIAILNIFYILHQNKIL